MKKKSIILSLMLFILSTVGLGCYFVKQTQVETKKYKWNKPTVIDIVDKTLATGVIKPRQAITIKPQVTGVISEIYVEGGMEVKKGQKIAKVKIIPNQVSINVAQSSVELARIRLKEAESELVRQQSIISNRLDIKNAEANLNNARQEKERHTQLLDKGVISQQEFQKVALEESLREVDYKNAQLLSQTNISQFQAAVQISKQELSAAIDNLHLLREGASRQSGQVANIVVSTVDGMILDIPVELGTSVIERNTFNEGTTIATIANMNTLIFEGTVDEADVGRLQKGIPLEVTVGAIRNETYAGVLEYIAPQATVVEGSVKFMIKATLLPTENTFLRAGYSANAAIIIKTHEGVVTVKERDLIFEEDLVFVETKSNDGSPQKVPVEIGISNGLDVEIVKGLNSNELIRSF